MKFQIGDIVLVIHSQEEGKVIDLFGDDMVLLDVNGVQFPAYNDQIEYPYFKRFSQKSNIKKKPSRKFVDDLKTEKKPQTPKEENGVWLHFLPVFFMDEFGDENVDKLKLHLVNQLAVDLHFHYREWKNGEVAMELKQSIHPFGQVYLHDVPFEDLSDNPVFGFEFSLAKPDKKKAEYTEASLKLRAKQWFSHIEKMKEKNEAHFSFQLIDKYPDKKKEEHASIDVNRLQAAGYKIHGKSFEETPRSVVDLHIDKLTNQWRKMSNFEMLTLQLDTFEKYYDLAVRHYQPSLIIIHGVGSGKLREEIHERLKHKKEVSNFFNRFHPAFGHGATEILLSY